METVKTTKLISVQLFLSRGKCAANRKVWIEEVRYVLLAVRDELLKPCDRFPS